MKDERWKLKCLLFEFCDNRTRFRGQVWANGNVQKDLKRSQNGGLPVSFWGCLLESFFLCFLMVVMMLSETVLEGRVYKKNSDTFDKKSISTTKWWLPTKKWLPLSFPRMASWDFLCIHAILADNLPVQISHWQVKKALGAEFSNNFRRWYQALTKLEGSGFSPGTTHCKTQGFSFFLVKINPSKCDLLQPRCKVRHFYRCSPLAKRSIKLYVCPINSGCDILTMETIRMCSFILCLALPQLRDKSRQARELKF